MKTLEINEKSQKKGDILAKFLISHLLITQKYLTGYQSTFILRADMK